MIITIRPAPHAKECALGATKGCSKARNAPEKCASCTSCCEYKHCKALGEELAKTLTARGHQVAVIAAPWVLGYPDSKAASNTYAALDYIRRISPDLHIALHTNSAAASVRGVRIGYPQGDSVRAAASQELAGYVVWANKKAYPQSAKVKMCTYPFLELSRPACPAIYAEVCFANSNRADAQWLHENVKAIAEAYAEGIAAWIQAQEAKTNMTAYQAKIVCKHEAGVGLWSDSAKTARLAQIPKGALVEALSEADARGFVRCAYQGVTGWADGQYLQRAESAPVPATPPQEQSALQALYAAREHLNAAIRALGGA